MLWVQILILLILIGMNAFFASSEVALISLKQSSIRKLIQRGGLRGKALAALTGNTGRFLATVQVGVTLAGFLASAFAAESFSDPLTEFLERIGFDIFSHSVLDMVVVVFITVILSYLSLVFGELVPKQIGLRYSEFMAFNVALPIHFLANVAKPFVFILNASVDLCLKAMFGKGTEQEQGVTEEEIRTLVDIGGEQGIISPEKKEMLENVFEFSSREASEIMTHRTEITAVNRDAPPEEIERIFIHANYSRFPVYHEDIDEIVGIVHIRDYFTEKYRRGASPDLASVMKPAYLVPETIRADRLFTDSFADEHSNEHESLETIGENIWRVDASIRLEQIRRAIGIVFPGDSRYDTLGGLILARTGNVPANGTVIELSDLRISLQVESVKGQHIGKVILRKEREPAA